MNGRFERQLGSLENHERAPIHLEARIIGNLSDEADIEEPYIRILDSRFRKRLVAMWPNGAERFPERIIVECRRGGHPYSFDTSRLIDCYINSLNPDVQAGHSLDIQNCDDESVIDARLSLIVPEKHRQEFNDKLLEEGYFVATSAAS